MAARSYTILHWRILAQASLATYIELPMQPRRVARKVGPSNQAPAPWRSRFKWISSREPTLRRAERLTRANFRAAAHSFGVPPGWASSRLDSPYSTHAGFRRPRVNLGEQRGSASWPSTTGQALAGTP